MEQEEVLGQQLGAKCHAWNVFQGHLDLRGTRESQVVAVIQQREDTWHNPSFKKETVNNEEEVLEWGERKLLGGSYNTSGKTGRLDRANDNGKGCAQRYPRGQLGVWVLIRVPGETLTFLANKEKIEMKKRTKQLAVLWKIMCLWQSSVIVRGALSCNWQRSRQWRHFVISWKKSRDFLESPRDS